jgi:hypothetical protein
MTQKQYPMTESPRINPFLPSWEYIPDGEPHVFGDRVYLYGSHDQYGGCAFCLGDYVCWSAPVSDLRHWTFEGVIYRKTDDPSNRDGKLCLYAPDVEQGEDGRYYLYYVLDQQATVGVAVCDQPAGVYRFLGRVRHADGTLLGERAGDEPQFDPAVLREGSRTYLFTGFCAQGDKSRHGAMMTVLDRDMLTVLQAPRTVLPGCEYAMDTDFAAHPYFEGPSIRKIGDLYYLAYSSLSMHALCYAIAERPEGPYRYQGVLVSNCDLYIDSYKPWDKPTAYGGNNHGGILTLGNTHYIFYPRHTNGHWYSRQACAEKLVMRPDHTFAQAPISSCGLNEGPLPGRGRYPANAACYLFTGDNECLSSVPGQPKIVQDTAEEERAQGYIVDIKDGTTIGFNAFRFEKTRGLGIRTRGYAAGTFEVRLQLDGPPLAEIGVRYTSVWADACAAVSFPDGVSRLFLTYRAPLAPPDPSHASLQLHSIVLY